MLEYVWNEYQVEFRKYGKRVVETLKYLDVKGETRRLGDSVTVNVNKEKRIGIIVITKKSKKV